MRLPEFFAALDRYDGHIPMPTLVDLLQQVQVDREEVEHAVRFGDDRYARNVLHLGTNYVTLILCWRSGQRSPIHDHRGSGCAVRVIEGTASEIRYERGPDGMLVETTRNAYPVDAVCGSYDADIHVMHNDQPAGQDLITMHTYTPPMKEVHIYALGSTEVETWTDVETLEAQRALQQATARS